MTDAPPERFGPLSRLPRSPRDQQDINRDIAIRAQQERDNARASLFEALVAIGHVADLHQPDETGRACECGVTWPCPTARVVCKWAET